MITLKQRIQNAAQDRQWYECIDNATGLAAWMVEECIFTTPEHVVYFFQKLWKWETEFHCYLAYNKATTDERREYCVYCAMECTEPTDTQDDRSEI